MKKDEMGNRLKGYENQTCGVKMIPLLPVIARLDGKGFSKFTKGLRRPYDERLSKLMIETTKYLVKETNARCGYTQSDEITLVWYSDTYDSKIYFDGRLFKMISDLSSMCSVYFNSRLSEFLPEKFGQLPRFDCRVFNVPTKEEAANVFLWREKDATKNSITMAASEFYSHNFLMNKNSSEKQELLFEKGINWNDYPSFFKKGTYIQKKTIEGKITEDELINLPPKHMARIDKNFTFKRSHVIELDLPPLYKVENRVGVIIDGEDYKKFE